MSASTDCVRAVHPCGTAAAAGNGYFGCMIALVSSGYILIDAVMAEKEPSTSGARLSIQAN